MPAKYLIDIDPIVRRATELAASLRRHGSLAEVRDFNERLDALVAATAIPGLHAPPESGSVPA